MKVLFISSGKGGRVGDVVKNQGESLKTAGIVIDYFIIKPGIWGYLVAIRKLRLIYKRGNYDLAHAHYALSGWASILSIPRSKVVVSYMGCDTYGDYGIGGNKKISSYLIILVGQILQPFVKNIIVKSHNLEKYIFQKSKVHIIPNGVNLNAFKPLDKRSMRVLLNLSQDKRYVLFLGNPMDSRKNYRLVKEVKNTYNMNFEILNPYPVQNSEVPAYLGASDLLILTSYNEGSPNIIKEAMACNCPIVATDVGDIRWVIGDTKGCYISTFESQVVAEMIRKALDFGHKTNGRQRIIDLGLDSDSIALKIINLYKDILN